LDFLGGKSATMATSYEYVLVGEATKYVIFINDQIVYKTNKTGDAYKKFEYYQKNRPSEQSKKIVAKNSWWVNWLVHDYPVLQPSQ